MTHATITTQLEMDGVSIEFDGDYWRYDIKGTSDTDPHIVFGTLSDAFGVAMPIRVTNSIPNNDFALPAWL